MAMAMDLVSVKAHRTDRVLIRLVIRPLGWDQFAVSSWRSCGSSNVKARPRWP